MSDALRLVRVSNACTWLTCGNEHVLTDPWFTRSRFFTEPPAVRVGDLPQLTAMLGCHDVSDHWDIDALASYPFKPSTRVLVATPGMAAKARAAGFSDVQVAGWGMHLRLSETLEVEVLPGRLPTGRVVNSYVLSWRGLRIFFGGEARDLEPLREYRRDHAAVDLFLAPVNGMMLMRRRLVMTASEAVEAAAIMGARVMVPIHDAHRAIWPFGRPVSHTRDAVAAAAGRDGLRMVTLAPGEWWVYPSPTCDVKPST